MDEWTGGQIDRQKVRQTDGWTDRRLDRQTVGQTDGWTNRRSEKQTDRFLLNLCLIFSRLSIHVRS